MRAFLVVTFAVATACGGSFVDRAETTLATALSATSAARDQFVVWDEGYQRSLVESSETQGEAEAKLTWYRERQLRVQKAFVIAYGTIGTAAALLPLVEAGQKSEGELAALLLDVASAARSAISVVQEMRESLSMDAADLDSQAPDG